MEYDLGLKAFNTTCDKMGARTLVPVKDIYDRLVKAYGETHRHYHTMTHIHSCISKSLDLPRAVKDTVSLPEVQFALWFHDYVYNILADNNELRSAQIARGVGLKELEIPMSSTAEVYNLILATNHKCPISSENAKMVTDIDLSILGAEDQEYYDYTLAIRAEYHVVPMDKYKKGRIAILNELYNRPSIYYTEYAKDRWEKKAKKNLKREIKELNA